ncbi:MAG: tetratricopeptide 2 repeat protein [Acidobacteriaceae bacterium]|nr:tetratricopeptide 2 repeat protein [Acidobacteriaceae bacterium]
MSLGSIQNGVAEWLNVRGTSSSDAGKNDRANRYYKLATKVAPSWSTPWYNLGLQAKYRGDWKNSLRFNQRSLELNPENEGACWNLGIAATALHNWAEARRAWKAYGIEVISESDEVLMPPVSACVRLNPENAGEVVWGERLDPARFVILNVPLPESKHRFNDIVLNDGAQSGTRIRDGLEVPVFDELEMWKKSDYSTFTVEIHVPDETAQQKLMELCDHRRLGLEDWSTIRIICAECSKGSVAPHKCEKDQVDENRRNFAFAAKNQDDVLTLLRDWKRLTERTGFGSVELVLAADSY